MTVVAFPERLVDGEVWEPWVDEDVVARHFRTSARTVRRWRARGMPSKKVGGLRRYRLSACEAWHDRQEEETTS